MTQSLAQYLAARNAETLAWVAECPETRFAFLLTEDLVYWAQSGVTTPDELDLELARGTYSDLYKDAYGCRPRYDLPQTLEELLAAIDELYETIGLNAQWEAEAEEEQREYFDRLDQEYNEEFARREAELREYREGQVWANFQEGWI